MALISQLIVLGFLGIGAAEALYHLAPAGSHKCDYGVSASAAECQAAALGLAANPRRTLQTGSGGTCLDGGWGQVPLGCSAQTGGDNAAHYKTAGDTGSGCIHAAYQLVCKSEDCCSNELFHVQERRCVPGCNQYMFDLNRCKQVTKAAGKWTHGQGRDMNSPTWAPGCTSAGVWMYYNKLKTSKLIQGVTKLYCDVPYKTCQWNELYHVGRKTCIPGCNEYLFDLAECKRRSPKAWGGGSLSNTRCNWAPGCTSAGYWSYFNANRQSKITMGVIILYCKRPYSG